MNVFIINLIIVCNEGIYGVNCLFNCSGNCFDGKVCDKVNGNCSFCVDGYKGLKCEKSRLYIKYNFVDENCKYLF